MARFVLGTTVTTWLLLLGVISVKPAGAEEVKVVENQSNQLISNVENATEIVSAPSVEATQLINNVELAPSANQLLLETPQQKEASFLAGTKAAVEENKSVCNKVQKVAQQPVELTVPDGAAEQTEAPANCNTEEIIKQLNEVPNQKFVIPSERSYSPALTISNPQGFGADNNTVFLITDFQSRTRYTKDADGELGIGYAFGDAQKAVGAEVSYTINSFGARKNGAFASAFNVKVHRRISDDSSIAVGWNQFARIESRQGYGDYPKNSYYGVFTKIFKTREFIDEPLSRVAVSVGVGSGQFLSEDTLNKAFAKGEDPTGLNVFGSLSVRIAQPVSAIVEWTGQDLAAGLSIVPFKNLPIVITPAVRDITGAGDGARFVLGTGITFQF
jgi:hypothetical protein